MASTRKHNDFEERFFDLLGDKLDGVAKQVEKVDSKVEHNTMKTEEGFLKLTSRVNKIEKRVFPDTPITTKDLQPLWRDPTIISKVLFIIAIFGVILAGILRVDITGIVP